MSGAWSPNWRRNRCTFTANILGAFPNPQSRPADEQRGEIDLYHGSNTLVEFVSLVRVTKQVVRGTTILRELLDRDLAGKLTAIHIVCAYFRLARPGQSGKAACLPQIEEPSVPVPWLAGQAEAFAKRHEFPIQIAIRDDPVSGKAVPGGKESFENSP